MEELPKFYIQLQKLYNIYAIPLNISLFKPLYALYINIKQ